MVATTSSICDHFTFSLSPPDNKTEFIFTVIFFQLFISSSRLSHKEVLNTRTDMTFQIISKEDMYSINYSTELVQYEHAMSIFNISNKEELWQKIKVSNLLASSAIIVVLMDIMSKLTAAHINC